MAASTFITISKNNNGVTKVSENAIKDMTHSVLEDIPYIDLDGKNTKAKARLKDISVEIKETEVSIKVELLFKSGVQNLDKLSSEVQKDIYDNFLTMMEYSNVKINIKIGGIY